MDLQAEDIEETQLKNLYSKGQELIKKRAEDIIKKLEALSNQTGQNYLLSKIHLRDAVQYINTSALQKQKMLPYIIENEQQIIEDLRDDAEYQNIKLREQIEQINKQIEDLKKKKQGYILTQQMTSRQILQLDQKIAQKNNTKKAKSKDNESVQEDPGFGFAYEALPDGSYQFRKSYVDIINHYFQRIQENEAIVQKLQHLCEEKIKKTEHTKFTIEKINETNKMYNETVKEIEKVQKKSYSLKYQLRWQVRSTSNQIQKKLATEIEKVNKQITSRRLAYQKTYHCLLGLMDRVINHADLAKVTDNISQL